MFEIRSARDFLTKMLADFAALQEDIGDSGRALNCILSTCHLQDWVWVHWLEPQVPLIWEAAIIQRKSDFTSWLEDTFPAFNMPQDLSQWRKALLPQDTD